MNIQASESSAHTRLFRRKERNYWTDIQKLKNECLRSKSLQTLLISVLQGLAGFCDERNANWFQINGFDMQPEIEPSDVVFLAGLDIPPSISAIDVCLGISSRDVRWSRVFNGLTLEYGSWVHRDETLLFFRLGDNQFGLDHWMIVESRKTRPEIFEDSMILESFTEILSGIYLEKAHWFNMNRRLSKHFDLAFESATDFIVFDDNLRSVVFSDHPIAEALPSILESRLIEAVIRERLEQWREKELDSRNLHTRVASMAFRVGHLDIVALVKYDSMRAEFQVILNRDSVQTLRSKRARSLFTKRQYEAFLHFENGCVTADELSGKMGISPRTAERYRGIILYHLENGLSPILRS